MSAAGVLIEAEEFDDFGGWVLDSQFETQMGSPYLLAHGLGRPVADATTTIDLPEAGRYTVWVRAKDWVPAHHPGRFTLTVNGTTVDTEFGANGQDWAWQSAGELDLRAGPVPLVLHDLTGFDGRCDAIFLSPDGTRPPDGNDDTARAWRKVLRGIPEQPVDAGTFDVVVVGGGIAGSATALAAARLGCSVALVGDRPFLGGNASVEIGLTPRGVTGPLVDELSRRGPDGDLAARTVLDAEPNVALFLEHTVFALETDGSAIVSVDARAARTGVGSRISGGVFVDCTGKAQLGLLAGAETMFGQEAHDEYGEPLAPEQRNDHHHGNTVFFRTREADGPVDFPDVPWAVEVAKDFASLNGQLSEPGTDNVPGPVAGPDRVPDPATRRRMLFPATHFWEYGQDLDPYTEGEHIRDHLLRALYGTFSNVRRFEPETFANLELDWVAYVAAQGEFRRYRGDYVLTENDVRDHVEFPDAVVQNAGPFCLHYGGHERYDFRLRDWKWDTRGDDGPYAIPFRCLYSVNVSNLMMAGKHISVTHVAGSNTKFMGNGGQHGIATAAAAFLCGKYDTTPRGVHDEHLDELRALVGRFSVARSVPA